MIRHCTYHCAICDAHFNSLAGFDAHRPSILGCGEEPINGKDGKRPQWGLRPGVCDLTKGKIGQAVPCLIWYDTVPNPRFIPQNTEEAKVGSDLSTKGNTQADSENGPTDSPRTPTGTLAPTEDSLYAETLYLSGYYRHECRVCGEPIKRTGRVGRAPIKHRECVK